MIKSWGKQKQKQWHYSVIAILEREYSFWMSAQEELDPINEKETGSRRWEEGLPWWCSGLESAC